MKPYIEIGELVAVHGVHGELKLYPWADSPGVLCKIDTVYFTKDGGGKAGAKLRPAGNMVLLKLTGIETPEAARAFIKRTVFAAREALPLAPGRFFVQDLLSCRIEDESTGEVYGVLKDITNSGASDVYKIENEAGQVFYFPAAAEFLGEINPDEGFIKVRPIGGMFDHED